jgi:hypothetical protein
MVPLVRWMAGSVAGHDKLLMVVVLDQMAAMS